MKHARAIIPVVLFWVAGFVGFEADSIAQGVSVSEPQELDITPGGYHPAWSPDGQTLAYTGGDWPDVAIYLVPVAGGVSTRIETGLYGDYYISWRNDSQRLIFDCYGPGTEHLKIWTVGVDGSDLYRVSQTNTIDLQPTWSPDGTRILFGSSRYGSLDLFTCDPDGTSVVRLTNHSGWEGHSKWSPDGEYVVFTTDRHGAGELYIKPAAGGDLRRLTTHTAHDDRADWSPDGEWIAFNSNRGGTDDIWIVPAEGGDPIQITHSDGDARMATWSPDSRSLIYVDDSLWRVDLSFETAAVRTSHGQLRAKFR